MKRIILLLMIICSASGLWSQQVYSYEDLKELFLTTGPGVERLELQRQQSRAEQDLRRWNRLPSLSLGGAPGSAGAMYSYAPDGVGGIPGGSSSDLHTGGFSLAASALLPTEATLSASVSPEITAVVPDEGSTNFSASMPMDLSLRQKLFVGGRFISTSLKAQRDYLLLEGPALSSRLQELKKGNELVQNFTSAFLSTVYLNLQLELQQKELALLSRELDQIRKLRQQGSAAGAEVWQKEITLNSTRDKIADLEYKRLLQRGNLAVYVPGLEEMDAVLDTALPVKALTLSQDELLWEAEQSSPDILLAEIGSDSAAAETRLAGEPYAPELSMNFRLTPAYGADSGSGGSSGLDSRDFSSAVGDLFSTDSEWKWRGSVGVRIPITASAQRKAALESAMAGEKSARLNAEESRRLVISRMKSLLANDSLLETRIANLEDSLSYAKERAGEEERLLELAASTRTDYERALLLVQGREIELWKAKADLFENRLAIESLTGIDLLYNFK